MTYSATQKQKSFFRSLTGDNLPSGCTKSKASTMIAQALAGTLKKKARNIRVSGYSFTDCFGTTAPVEFHVQVDYRTQRQGFTDFEAALAWAQATYSDEAIIEDRQAVARYCVD